MTEREIFINALEKIDLAERAAYLDSACETNQALKQRIELLIKAHEDAGSLLDHAVAHLDETQSISGSAPQDKAAAKPIDEPGDDLTFLDPPAASGYRGRLGNYDIIDVVGRGGMGIVLRAFDSKLDRIIALKVLAPAFAANATARKRFAREARAAAAVSHPHVVTIHGVNETAGTPFLVMECIDGQSLRDKIDNNGPLEVKEILRIGMQIAGGLAAAHAQGLIHRDIKPANILLENGIERVKITDFGLARTVDDVALTQTGHITGTPQYMSPEQAQGDAVDVRSDLFSLGSVLYTMCTGRPPFRGDNTVSVIRRVCDEAPRPIREVNPEIPDWLVAIIDKLLAKSPDQRFQSATEVAGILGGHLAHLQNPAQVPMPATVAVPQNVACAAAAGAAPYPGPPFLLWFAGPFIAALTVVLIAVEELIFDLPEVTGPILGSLFGIWVIAVFIWIIIQQGNRIRYHEAYRADDPPEPIRPGRIAPSAMWISGGILVGLMVILGLSRPFRLASDTAIALWVFCGAFAVWLITFVLWVWALARHHAGKPLTALSSWWLRVPAPAQAAIVPLTAVYLVAIADLQQHIRGMVAEGTGQYLLAVAVTYILTMLVSFLIAWCIGAKPLDIAIAPDLRSIAIFYTFLTLGTFGFVESWGGVDLDKFERVMRQIEEEQYEGHQPIKAINESANRS